MSVASMVLILDGNSLSSAHGRSYGTIVWKEFVLLTLRLLIKPANFGFLNIIAYESDVM